MFSVAWTIVDVYNKRNWEQFIEFLKVDIQMYKSKAWTFIPEKTEGFGNSIDLFSEGVEHRYCARHLYSNFTLVHKSLTLKSLFWYIARAKTMSEQKSAMNKMKEVNEESFKQFQEKPTLQWTRSHFQEHSRRHVLLNNLYEAFKSSILVAREMVIISLQKKFRHQQMMRMNRKKEKQNKDGIMLLVLE